MPAPADLKPENVMLTEPLRPRGGHSFAQPPAEVRPAGLIGLLWSSPALYRATRWAARIAGRLIPAAVLGRLPVARLWATGRTIPDVSHAGEGHRTPHSNPTASDGAGR